MASEKKLISVDDLKAKIEITDTDVCADYGDGFCQHGYSNQLLRLMVNELPTIDAVEVVRCKDCKRAQHDRLYGGIWCDGHQVPKDHFCGYGAKMDGVTEDVKDICKTTGLPCIKCNPGPCEHRKVEK